MAAEKITIARISSFVKDKEGNALINKNGKPYTRVLIDTTDGRKLSGFGNQTTSNWNEGMEVDVEITESNGFLNFSVPKANDSAVSEMAIKTHIDRVAASIRFDLKVIADHLGVEAPKTENQTRPNYPDDPQLEKGDIPFQEDESF